MRLYFVTIEDELGQRKGVPTNRDRQSKLYTNKQGPRQALARHGGGFIWCLYLTNMVVTMEEPYGFKYDADYQVG